jgi:APA family basic amino acid/polyamine antiporter
MPDGEGFETELDGSWARFFIRKSEETYQREAEESELERTLSALDLTLLGVGAMVGAGIFTVIGTVSALYAGPSVALSFAVAAFASGLTALCYAELVTVVPVSGSAYAYTYATLGELLAWLVGWNLILEYLIGNTAVAVAWSSNFGKNILPLVGLEVPQALQPLTAGGSFDIMAVFIMLLITAILVLGIEESSTANNYLVAFLALVLLVFIGAGSFFVDPANLANPVPYGWASTLGTAPALVFFAFIGFDAVSTAVEETKDPQENVPKGILGSLGVTAVLYMLTGLVLTGMVSYQRLNVGDPLAFAFDAVGQPELGVLIAFGAVAATTSTLLVFQLGSIRIILNMARDGFLPDRLAEINPRFKTPTFLTVVAGLLVALPAAVVPLNVLVELTNVGTLFAFATVIVALIYRRQRRPEMEADFEVPLYPWVPLLGLAMVLFLMSSLPTRTLIRFVGWMGVGLMVYGFYGASKSEVWRERQAASEPDEPGDGSGPTAE